MIPVTFKSNLETNNSVGKQFAAGQLLIHHKKQLTPRDGMKMVAFESAHRKSKTKLATHHVGLVDGPVVVADPAPFIAPIYCNCPRGKVVPINKLQVSIYRFFNGTCEYAPQDRRLQQKEQQAESHWSKQQLSASHQLLLKHMFSAYANFGPCMVINIPKMVLSITSIILFASYFCPVEYFQF